MTGALQVVEVTGLPRQDDGRVDLSALRAVLGDVEVLETARDAAGTEGWSYVAVRGVARLVATPTRAGLSHQPMDTAVELLAALPEEADRLRDPLAMLDPLCEVLGLTPAAHRDASLPAFTGGWLGVLGHDLARTIERLPSLRQPSGQPDMDLRLVDTVLAWRPDRDAALLMHRPMGAPAPDLVGIRERLTRPRGADTAPPQPILAPSNQAPQGATSSMGRRHHRDAVERVLGHIAAGDAFQVNVTHRLSAPWDQDLLALYTALRAASPAAYGAVIPGLADHGGGLVSVSPETFLEADGRDVRVRPIKGTRPRRPLDASADAAQARELAASPKDAAENIMVVDMERNDLGRVCEVGSVRVPRLLEVERHPTVWHLVSTVEGRLRDGIGWGGLLRATFPCGSVTGTPKVRALQIIEEIEPVRRGLYCGAIGFLSAGAAHTSVAIRTAVLHPDGHASYGAGGGIVADSDPDAEWYESLDKAAAFLAATNSRLQESDR